MPDDLAQPLGHCGLLHGFGNATVPIHRLARQLDRRRFL